jgi:hypothetical protein
LCAGQVSLLLVLLMLLHALDLVPDQIPGFALHLDRIAQVRRLQLQQVLDLPDVGQRPCQQLRRTRLLTLLLLTFLRHRDLLFRCYSCIYVYPLWVGVRQQEVPRRVYLPYSRGMTDV